MEKGNRYYLLRKNHEFILGPRNLSEVARIYRDEKHTSEFEVCGNLGSWYYVRDRHNIEKHYPELFNIFYSSEKSEHLVSAYSGFDDVSGKPRGLPKGLIFIGIFLAIVVVLTMFYLRRRDIDRSLAEALHIYNGKNYMEAIVVMEKKPHLLEALVTRAKISSHWLPMLRTVSFHSNLKIGLMGLALVKDTASISSPDDCSVDNWTRIWKGSSKQWGNLISEQNLPNSHWALLLSWDSHWLHNYRREGWLDPHSYEHGCFLSAYKSFVALSFSGNEFASVVRERIMWQSRVLNPLITNHPSSQNSTNLLLVWNCLEQSNNLKSLNTCQSKLKNHPSTPLFNYTQEKYYWNRLRILQSMLNDGKINKNSLPKVSRAVDSYNSIDYRHTIDFLSNSK